MNNHHKIRIGVEVAPKMSRWKTDETRLYSNYPCLAYRVSSIQHDTYDVITADDTKPEMDSWSRGLR